MVLEFRLRNVGRTHGTKLYRSFRYCRPHDVPPTPRQVRFPDQLRQACGADDAVVMFRDAFATEKTAALRAPRHRFTLRVIETSLSGEILHELFKRCSDRPQAVRRVRNWRRGIYAATQGRQFPGSLCRQSRLSSSRGQQDSPARNSSCPAPRDC